MRRSRSRRVLLSLPVAGALSVWGSGVTSAGGLPTPAPALMACQTSGTATWDYFVTHDNRGGSWPNWAVTLTGTGACATTHGSLPVSFTASGDINYVNPYETFMWWDLEQVSITIGGQTFNESWWGEDTGKASNLGMDPLPSSPGDRKGSGVIVTPIVANATPTNGTTRFKLVFEKPVPFNLVTVVG